MEERANVLRGMKICRFCLTEDGPFSSIYEKQQGKDGKQIPLPLQLMACVAIEVFANDGMPQLICKFCRIQTLQAYMFKTNCKKADDALKVYLATGNLVKTDIQTIKTNDEPSPKRKKMKTAHSDIITLNYSNNFNQNNDKNNEQEHINNENSNNNEHSMSIEEGDDVEEDVEDDEDYEDDECSKFAIMEGDPLFHVNQVKTDCFSCPHCERSFPLKQLLELHVKNHERERNFNCEECDKAFFTKYDLSKHMLTHSNSKPFTCIACNKSFSRESLLHRHEKIHVDIPKYVCMECDKTFLTGEDLDAHTAKQHKKNRPYSCKFCNKSFVFKQGLERHEQSHTNVRPHKCNYCEASFTSAIKLTRHVTSHAGLRPYPCKICGRTFLLSHHLTRHMRSHYAAHTSEIMPPIGQHKCDICSMSFRRKDSLINHSAIHSMVNLKCVICNTEFDNVVKVKEHITTHLSDLPFPCEKCDYSFETQEQLEDHELKHAEMEYEEQIEQEVIEEERKKQAAGYSREQMGENSDEYSGDDEIAEFTITNDLSNPEIVRRSKRTPKVKNYSEFLKDELGSDLEEVVQEDNIENANKQDDNAEEMSESQGEKSEEDNLIKPIVRVEGTKVYARRSLPERPKMQSININQITAPLSTINHSTNLLDDSSSSSKDIITKLPNKEIFNMKIGDKTVTVQKLLLTKEQMKAMAKEGKIEKKGNTLLLKKNARMSLPNINLDSLLNETNKTAIINLKSPLKDSEKNNESANSDIKFDDSLNLNL